MEHGRDESRSAAWTSGMDLQNWVNEGLMTLFFLVVALEVKREVTTGELRDPKKAAMPIIAAIGGMVVPAGIYLLLNAGSDTAGGWGVPVATDIAFALGVLTIAASRAPCLLAIVSADSCDRGRHRRDRADRRLLLEWARSRVAGDRRLVVLSVFLAQTPACRIRSCRMSCSGLAFGSRCYESGVNPTLAGVVLGLMAPAVPLRRSPRLPARSSSVLIAKRRNKPDGRPRHTGSAMPRSLGQSVSPLDRVEASLHPWTSRVVVPIFALANAGIVVSGATLSETVTSPLGLGVLLGLVVGKPLGIGAAIWAGTRSPDRATAG